MSQSSSRTNAIAALLANINAQNYVPCDGAAYTIVQGSRVYMPAYVPYVGPAYFEHRPRILCYAINQNLSRHRHWSEQWMQEWALDHLHALDRLNRAAAAGRAIPIKPYAEGFIPLAALLCLCSHRSADTSGLPPTIDRVVSVTNFVKFSTSDSASSSAIPDSWWDESGSRYVRAEIETLRPDIIITFGKRTKAQLDKVLADMRYPRHSLRTCNCRFPGRISSDRSRPPKGKSKELWAQRILPLAARIETPQESFASMRMTRFPSYFLEIAGDLRFA